MKCIVLCGGGTAGHIMPAIALLPELKKYFDRIVYIGSADSMEKKLSEDLGLEFYSVNCAKLYRSFSFKNLLIPFKLFKGITESEKILKEIKPSVVFSKGGYVSMPVVIAASKLEIPVVAHESDLSPGLANRFTAKYCSCICTSFERCAKRFKEKGVYTKTPIRRNLLFGNRENIMSSYSLDKNKPVLLIMGGSSGARFLNELIRKSLNELLKSFNIIHITGKGNISGNNLSGYVQIEFTENIADIFAAADYVICRAGSNTIFELLTLKKPMLLVPLPKGSSRGDQIENAEYFAGKKCVHTILQRNLNEKTLIEEIKNLISDKQNIIENINKQDLTPGTTNVLKQILKYSDKK